MCRVWYKQVETDAVNCFIRGSMLLHDPFEIMVGQRVHSDIRPKRLVYMSAASLWSVRVKGSKYGNVVLPWGI